MFSHGLGPLNSLKCEVNALIYALKDYIHAIVICTKGFGEQENYISYRAAP